MNDSTVYDTTSPILVTNIDGNTAYEYGVDYDIMSETGTFKIMNSELLSSGELAVSYRYFLLDQFIL